MKTCVLMLGNDQKAVRSTAEELATTLANKNLPDGKTSIVCVGLELMDAVLKRGAKMPREYSEAERRLMMGIDKECIAYTEKISEELAKTEEPCPGKPEVLLMSGAVLAECKRRGIRSVYVHNTARLATDPDLLHKLRRAGLQACCPPEDERLAELNAIMLAMMTSRSNEQTTQLMNRFREQMSYLADQMKFQVALFDREAWPLWKAEKLSSKWGPELLDGYGLYLNAAADWAAKAAKNQFTPPPTH